jgi:hypothetical protein
VTENKVGETSKTFIWERDAEIVFDEFRMLTAKRSRLTTEWDNFNTNMVLPVRNKLVANTIEKNKLLAVVEYVRRRKIPIKV